MVLKTAIIENECIKRFKKFIFEGPKYLNPLSEGEEIKFFSNLVKDPEKLLHVDLSLMSL